MQVPKTTRLRREGAGRASGKGAGRGFILSALLSGVRWLAAAVYEAVDLVLSRRWKW